MTERRSLGVKSTYRTNFYVLNGLIAPTISLLITAVGIFILTKPLALEKNHWFASLLCFLIALSLLVASFAALLRHRPINITTLGISTSIFGLKLKEIDWSKIKRIERRRYTDPQRRTVRFSYFVFGTQYKIWFDDGLLRLADVLDVVNKYIRENSIEIISVDVGTDTLESVKRTITNPNELKKILRSGVKTRISEL
ncbi:MAG: hypothetical protein J0I26_05120 [Alphaproteobacteria bacterium]|jgi:hypothetical protein|nr:hypothetical protein [Alphaproteobacteria bacterium]MBN9578073.1 hypothetical protein [Alphaproteobacteria bacterium]